MQGKKGCDGKMSKMKKVLLEKGKKNTCENLNCGLGTWLK
jgi:hypothetical protein